jgi:hypothetical protein
MRMRTLLSFKSSKSQYFALFFEFTIKLRTAWLTLEVISFEPQGTERTQGNILNLLTFPAPSPSPVVQIIFLTALYRIISQNGHHKLLVLLAILLFETASSYAKRTFRRAF